MVISSSYQSPATMFAHRAKDAIVDFGVASCIINTRVYRKECGTFGSRCASVLSCAVWQSLCKVVTSLLLVSRQQFMAGQLALTVSLALVWSHRVYMCVRMYNMLQHTRCTHRFWNILYRETTDYAPLNLMGRCISLYSFWL